MQQEPSGWTDEFVDRLRARDSDAESELIESYGRKLITYLESHGFRYHDAEDLAYEAVYKAHSALDTYHTGKGAFSTWLFRIARNTAIDFLKRPQHQWYGKVLSLDALFQMPEEEDRAGDYLDGVNLTEAQILAEPQAEDDELDDDEGNDAGRLVLPRDRSELPYKEMAEVVTAVFQKQKPGVQRAFELRYKEARSVEETIQCLLDEGLYRTHSAAESAISRLKGKVEKALRADPRFKHLFHTAHEDSNEEDNEPPDKTLTAD